MGGTRQHLIFAVGQQDVICLIKPPNDQMMAAIAMAVAASGIFAASSTIRPMSSAKAKAARQTAGKAIGSYKPPMR